MSDSLQNKPRIFGCKTNDPIKFLVCGQLISPSGFLHHRRSFDENVLIMVTEGTLYITANNAPFSLVPGQYIFLKAGEEHYGHRPSDGRLSYLWAHFRSDCGFETVNNDSSEYTYLLPEALALSDSGRTAQLFHQLMDMSLEEKLYTQNMSDYAMSLLLMELTQEYFRDRDSSDKLPLAVVSAREWIKNHYYLPFDVRSLAEAVGYSADYLSSLFKQSTGISIVRYTNRLRIKTAKTLLSNYDITIKEAAFSCGFSDEKYFMKVFKQLEGITPSQYKNSFGRKNIN
ncbi:MAG: AraC family transcriptional regulator [Huintestinicola sp.]|uniref:helix-turn-helix transcriptional regulator n=1 Tax=Huintestinicola sp. TaxID=2981661 RepID=UPI003F0AA9B6